MHGGGCALVDEGQAAGDAGGGAALRHLGAAHGTCHAKLADVEVGAVAVAAVQHGPDHGLAGQWLVAAHLVALEAVCVRAHAAALTVHVLHPMQRPSISPAHLAAFLTVAPLFAWWPIMLGAQSLPVMPGDRPVCRCNSLWIWSCERTGSQSLLMYRGMADLATLHERGEGCGDGRLNRRASLHSVAALREAHLCAIAHRAVQDQVAAAAVRKPGQSHDLVICDRTCT